MTWQVLDLSQEYGTMENVLLEHRCRCNYTARVEDIATLQVKAQVANSIVAQTTVLQIWLHQW